MQIKMAMPKKKVRGGRWKAAPKGRHEYSSMSKPFPAGGRRKGFSKKEREPLSSLILKRERNPFSKGSRKKRSSTKAKEQLQGKGEKTTQRIRIKD